MYRPSRQIMFLTTALIAISASSVAFGASFLDQLKTKITGPKTPQEPTGLPYDVPDHFEAAFRKAAETGSLDLKKRKMTDAELQRIAPSFSEALQSLDLSQNDIKDAGALALAKELPRLKNLATLKLDYEKMGKDALEALKKGLQDRGNLASNNEMLSLIDRFLYPIPERFQEAFRKAGETGSLDLKKRKMTDAELQRIAPLFSEALQSLDLSENDIKDAGALALAKELPRLKNLATLKLDYEKIGKKGLNALLEAVQNMGNLESKKEILTTINRLLYPIPEKFQEVFRKAAETGSLQLNDVIMTWDLEWIGLHLPTNLRELVLGGIKIGNESLKALAPYLPANLQKLTLKDNEIGDAGLKALVPYLPATLRELNLRGTNVVDEGLKALAPHLPAALQELDLSWTDVGDEGLKAMAPHLPAALQKLDLSWTKVGDEGLKALSPHLPATLRVLGVFNVRISDEGLKALLKAIQETPLKLKVLDIFIPENSPFAAKFRALNNIKHLEIEAY